MHGSSVTRRNFAEICMPGPHQQAGLLGKGFARALLPARQCSLLLCLHVRRGPLRHQRRGERTFHHRCGYARSIVVDDRHLRQLNGLRISRLAHLHVQQHPAAAAPAIGTITAQPGYLRHQRAHPKRQHFKRFRQSSPSNRAQLEQHDEPKRHQRISADPAPSARRTQCGAYARPNRRHTRRQWILPRLRLHPTAHQVRRAVHRSDSEERLALRRIAGRWINFLLPQQLGIQRSSRRLWCFAGPTRVLGRQQGHRADCAVGARRWNQIQRFHVRRGANQPQRQRAHHVDVHRPKLAIVGVLRRLRVDAGDSRVVEEQSNAASLPTAAAAHDSEGFDIVGSTDPSDDARTSASPDWGFRQLHEHVTLRHNDVDNQRNAERRHSSAVKRNGSSGEFASSCNR